VAALSGVVVTLRAWRKAAQHHGAAQQRQRSSGIALCGVSVNIIAGIIIMLAIYQAA